MSIATIKKLHEIQSISTELHTFSNTLSLGVINESYILYDLSFLTNSVGQIQPIDLKKEQSRIETLYSYEYNPTDYDKNPFVLNLINPELEFSSILYFLLSLKDSALGKKYTFFVKDSITSKIFSSMAYNSKAFYDHNCWVFTKLEPIDPTNIIVKPKQLYILRQKI